MARGGNPPQRPSGSGPVEAEEGGLHSLEAAVGRLGGKPKVGGVSEILELLTSSGKKASKFGHFLVVVQLIHRLRQADISCTTTDC